MIGYPGLTVAVVIASLITVVVSYFVYHKWRNPIEEKMEEIIMNDVGVDIDNYLPADTTTTTITASASKTTSTESVEPTK